MMPWPLEQLISSPHQKQVKAGNRNTQDTMPLAKYLSLLKVGGTFYSLGMPEGNLPPIPPVSLVYGNISLRGSNIGSRKEILQMLDLVAEKGVQSWVQVRKMKEGGRVLEDLDNGKGRYRWVLEMDIEP
jgi:alcohol dehydrogenase (NADP+)